MIGQFRNFSLLIVAVVTLLCLSFIIWIVAIREPEDTKWANLERPCKSAGVMRADSFMQFSEPNSQVCIVDLYLAGFVFERKAVDRFKVSGVSECQKRAILKAGQIWQRSKDYFVSEDAPDGKWMGFIDCNADQLLVFSVGESGYGFELESAPNSPTSSSEFGLEKVVRCVSRETTIEVAKEDSLAGSKKSCVFSIRK